MSRGWKPQSAGIAATRVLGWLEVFVLIPLHAFWVMYSSTPFAAENPASMLVVLVPLGVLGFVGLLGQLRVVRWMLVELEWWFHVTAATLMTLLTMYFAMRDPFAQPVPLTWPLCVWSVAMTLALLANLGIHERTRHDERTLPQGRSILLFLAAWGAMLWLGSGMAWKPYFWTASIVFHAVMAPLCRSGLRFEACSRADGKRFAGVAAFAEALLLVSLLFAVLPRLVFAADVSSAAELKYQGFIATFASPWFLGGAAVALIARHYRLHLAAHAAAAVVVVATGESMSWPIALVAGYALPALFCATRCQGSLAYAVTALLVTFTWVFALYAFTLSGLITVFEMGLGAARSLVSNVRMVPLLLYGICLLFAGLGRWLRTKEAREEYSDVMSEISLPATYVLVCAMVLLPIAALMFTAMWPPVRMARPERVEVGAVSGICHAGYTRTDEEYKALKALGARMIRIPAYWGSIQPAPDTWDFSEFDAYVEAAERNGMPILAVLGFDNNAVEQSPEGRERGGFLAEEDIPLFAEFAVRMVGRYGDRVHAWEIWNEPDIPQFWGGTVDEFIPVAKGAAEAMREAHPDARIIGTAMTSMIGLYSTKGIEGLHKAGALSPVDHPAMHMYVSDARTYYNEFKRVRNAAAKYGHPGSVWITELGAPTGGMYPWRVPDGERPAHLIKAYTIATSLGFDKLFWHCYGDANEEIMRAEPLNSEHFFGLVTHEGEWKPAAHAYKLFSERCNDATIRCDLLDVSGGITARQLRATVYRRENNDSTLVLWFEPGLRQHASARVAIDFGAPGASPVAHDIASGCSRPFVDRVVDVTEEPLLITFKAASPDTPVRLTAHASPADDGWLVLLLGLLAWSAVTALRVVRRQAGEERQLPVD